VKLGIARYEIVQGDRLSAISAKILRIESDGLSGRVGSDLSGSQPPVAIAKDLRTDSNIGQSPRTWFCGKGCGKRELISRSCSTKRTEKNDTSPNAHKS
jgi:hypothetical protein